MKRLFIYVSCFITLSSFEWCKKPTGCMDYSAKNYDVEAEKDCGCCEFERVVFYSRYPAYNVGGVVYSINTYPIKLFIGTQEVGTVSAFYPNGPGNSNLPGIVVHNPGSQKTVEWYAKVTAPNGSFVILGSGTFSAGKSVFYVPIF